MVNNATINGGGWFSRDNPAPLMISSVLMRTTTLGGRKDRLAIIIQWTRLMPGRDSFSDT